MFPPELSNVTAASFVPSLDEVMEFQAFVLPGEAVFSVHVAPESVEVQMFPFRTTAASLVPSLEEVMEYQFFPLPGEAVFSVHVRACTGPHKHNTRTTANSRRNVREPPALIATKVIHSFCWCSLIVSFLYSSIDPALLRRRSQSCHVTKAKRSDGLFRYGSV